MALRSQARSRSFSRSAAATSGPGRAPASDGRARHRLRGGRDREASAEEIRRRTEALFGEPDGRGDRGTGGGGRARGVPSWAVGGGGGVGGGDEQVARPRRGGTVPIGTVPADTVAVGMIPVGMVATAGEASVGGGRTWEEEPGAVAPGPVVPEECRPVGRAGLALRERLPLWVRTRCGLERRSVVALSVVLVVAVGFAVQHFWTGRTQPVRAPEVVGAGAPPPGTGKEIRGGGGAGGGAARGRARG
ncbi:hypothetical protein ACFVIN_14035, partial [Streptomyces prasinus]